MNTELVHADAATVEADLLAACQTFVPDATRIAGVADHSDLARVETLGDSVRVRRWPSGTPTSDIAFSHRVLTVAHAAGLTVVPAVVSVPGTEDTVLRLNGYHYDAMRWLPGAPAPRSQTMWPEHGDLIDLPVVLPDTVFRDVVTFAASLHNATADLALDPDAPAAPLQMLPGAVQQAQNRHLNALRARAAREPAIQRWLATGERLLANAVPRVLSAADDPEFGVTVDHLALWPSHILIAEGKLSGVLGWDRAAVGTPLLDIAQTILRLHGWTDEIVEIAIGAYSEFRPLSPAERRLLPAVAGLDAVATTGRLLEQTYGGGRKDRPPTTLRAAIDMMLRSMSNLDRTLSTPDKPRRRVWHRQTDRPSAPTQGGRSRERIPRTERRESPR